MAKQHQVMETKRNRGAIPANSSVKKNVNEQAGSDEPQMLKIAGRYDFPEDKITDGMTLERIVSRCGELQMDYTNVCWLCRDVCDPKVLMRKLRDPESDVYAWYQSGVAQGNLKLNIDLEYNIGDPKAKDAYRHLSAERRRQAINRKLEELFGMGE
jgi:hypothetical protein